jgi:hypothetical protein
MKSILFLLSFLTISIASAQNPEKINIPKGVAYKYADNKVIEKAKALITDNISEADNYSILQKTFILGPGLWKRFQNIEKLQKIKGNATFHVDDLQLSGKVSQTMEEAKLIWDELRKEITGDYKIRKANELELKYYWSVISFDIEEPLLIIETKDHNYILNLLKSNLKLLWLDEVPPTKGYFNPIENTTYNAEGGMKTYQNGEEINQTSKGFKETKLERVAFLSSDKELEDNSSLEELKKIILETELIFNELFKNSDKSGKIMVQFELKKENNDIQFAVKDDLDLDIMKEFEKRVNSTAYPNSKKDPIKIQLLFKVNSFDDIQ